MARVLVLRAAASYQVQIQRKITVRPYWHKWFGSNEEYTTNGMTNSNGRTNGNKWLFKKQRQPTDFEKRIKDGENLKSKGIWAKVIEKKNQYFTLATTLATDTEACFWKVTLYPTIKYIDERFQAFETRLSKEDGSWITPTLKLKSLSQDEVKYLVPMPGMKLDECSYGWDVEGLSLTIRGDNGEYELRYTPEVPKRFRHGKVTFDSLAKGNLVVSVKARSYHNRHTQTQPDIPNEHKLLMKLSLTWIHLVRTRTRTTLTMQLLRDNLTLWTSDIADEAGNEIKESSKPEETK
ncbi:hypothetical protein Tco_0084347 [Tanacetum coccineum]